MTLRAVVIGTGWAGEGHTYALRDAGVEVVAICGRTPEPARARAAQLGIADVRFDWRTALSELRPDIVTIATPADMHRETAIHALALGCHVMCEKPLALHAADARIMLDAAVQGGTRHAYGPTGRYAPAVIYARELVAQGVIGAIREIEFFSRSTFPIWPLSWIHQLERGGGLLNNGFTHTLAQILHVSGGAIMSAIGATLPFHAPVPVGPQIHDLRQLFGPIPGWDPASATEWRRVDADAGYTVIVELRMPQGHVAGATCSDSIYGQSPLPGDLIAFYGDEGTLTFNSNHGAALLDLRLYRKATATWESLRVPDAVLAAQPQVEDTIQRYWNQLFREFVADIRGEGYSGYPTFSDGWVAMEVIDAVRERRLWRLPTPTEP